MRELIETVGQIITELVGLVGVLSGLFGAIVLLRTFGDNFIRFFI